MWSIPQIVRVLRYFEENDTAYIAMEYVDGMDLRKFVKSRQKPLTTEELFDILGPVIHALEYVHNADLVHRDISPDNIMVLPDGSSKLLDFGAARYVENADAEKERNTSTQTILKHGFAPPEQYRSHGALGPWTDIYAMCATVYYCLTGRVPPESMSRMMGEGQLELDKIPRLTQKQKQALEKGMALMPKDRIRSAEELYRELFSEIIAAREKSSHTSQEKGDTKKTSSAKSKGILVAAALAVVVAAGGSFLLSGGKNEAVIEQPATFPVMEVTESVPEEVPITELPVELIEITPELNLELEEQEMGYSQQLSVLSSQDRSAIQWSSSDPAVAEVSEDGTVTAVGYGIAEITASCGDQSAACQVYIFRKANIELQLGGNASTRQATGTISGDLILPGVIDGTIIKRIGAHTFEESKDIRRVVIPDMVEAIEKRAFNNCTNLVQIEFPQSLNRIGWASLAGTGLTEVVLPEGVTHLEWAAFQGCTSLRSAVLPDSLTTMEGAVFQNCTGLIEVNIPDGVTAIEGDTFLQCTSLREISIPDSVKSVGNRAFGNCKQLSKVEFSSSMWKIPYNAFENCVSLTEIVIPENITVIEGQSFRGCSNLLKVSIPPTVVRIEENAFGDCYKLESITVSPKCQVANGAIPPTCTVLYYE